VVRLLRGGEEFTHLEDIGCLARPAYVMDHFMHWMGPYFSTGFSHFFVDGLNQSYLATDPSHNDRGYLKNRVSGVFCGGCAAR
jgi:hypothetical protein